MNRSIKCKLLAFLTTLTLVSSVSVTSFAQEQNSTLNNAKESKYASIKTYAENYIKRYKSNVKLDKPIELFNANNDVVALFFADKNGGYIIVNTADESVPEFSPESSNKFIVNKDKKYFYNGPTVYMEEVNNKIIDSKHKSEIGTIDDLKDKLKNKKIYTPKIKNKSINATNNISVTASVKKISGTVPNYSYNPDGICGSTSSAMFLRYYDKYVNDDYVPSSLESSTGIALIKKLVPYIDGAEPGSNPGQLESGIYDYLKDQGVDATINLDSSSIGFIAGRVGNNQPFVLGLHNNPTYDEHWVTGYGYSGDYAIVNDGWGSTGVYIDVDYSDYIVY